MKLTLLAYLDLGVSFGVDDAAFRGGAARLFGVTGTTERALPVGVSLPLGGGLGFELVGTPLAAAWQAAAVAYARREDPAVLPFVEGAVWVELRLQIYALGVATIQASLRVAAPPALVIRVFQAFEYGGYDEPSTRLVAELQAFVARAPALETTRRRDLGSIRPFDLVPGFQCLLAPLDAPLGEDGVDALVEAARSYERQGPLTRLVLDDGVLHLGWAVAVYLPAPRADVERLYFLLELCHLTYGICEGFDQMLAERMRECVRSQLGDRGVRLHPRALNELRTLAMVVVRLTALDAVTNNLSDLALLTAFDGQAKIGARQARIQSSAEIFFAVQQEVAREGRAQQEQKVALLVLLLTAVSVVGLVADAWNLIDYDNTLMPDRDLRTTMLAGPALLTVVAALWLGRGRP